MQAGQTQSKQIKNCIHFKKLPINSESNKFDCSFIKPSIKGWLCLYDGCCRKQGTTMMMKQQLLRYEPNHKIFMEMNKLQIFCFECNIQITDQYEKRAHDIRKLAIQIDKEQEKMLFGANIEYPEGFQKEKAGLAGTVGTQLNSFINSAVQLMAHIPPFYQIIEQVNLATVKNQLLRKVFETVCKIRSGIYRIVETKQIQKQLVKQNPQFYRYFYKTPSNFYYEILRIFSMQFQYESFSCKPKQVIEAVSLSVLNALKDNKSNYSPMKQLFSGQFLWGVYCPQCTNEKNLKAQFQCIRLQDNHRSSQNNSVKLQQLIDSTFNLQKSFETSFQKIICENKECKNKQIQLKLNKNKSTLKIPNILLFQIGLNEQGLNVQCPDMLSFSKYKKSDDAEQFIYQYIGSIGRANKKYYTHVKQFRQQIMRQYIFDDVLIQQNNVQKPNKIKIVVYKMQPIPKNKILSKNVESSLIVDVQCIVPLPDFWNYYVSDLRFVQPLMNPFICRHGLLKPQIKSKSKIVKKIPPSIYQYLVEQFGGRSIKMDRQNHYCPTCTEKLYLLRQLKQSQKEMAKFADQLSSKKSRACVDIQWFEKWKRYLYNLQEIPYQSQNIKRPDQINNKKGFKDNGQIDQSKYKKVSPQVWYFFKKFYGGGPLIAQNLAQPSLALTQAVDLRYQSVKNLIAKLFQN